MLPRSVVVDNGRAFIDEDLKDVCGQLGINLEPNPTKGPWLKGEIERFFRVEPLPPEEGDEDSAK